MCDGSAPAGTLIGMSRTPVREAFLRLSTERLLDLYPKRGAVVTVPPTSSPRRWSARGSAAIALPSPPC
jgi:DNA-binding FadR family transcriptional regulator